MVNNEIKEDIKRFLKTNENENTTPKSVGYSKSFPKREIDSIIDWPQETRNISSKQSDFTLKGTRKNTKPKVSRRNEIIKSRADIIQIEYKKTI